MEKHVVLDTNVLLLDANNLVALGGDDKVIVLPETVLSEMDSKKSGFSEIAYQARAFGRLMASATDIRVTRQETATETNMKVQGIDVLVVALNEYKIDTAKDSRNDQKIIAVAKYVESIGNKVQLVSNDVLMRLRGLAVGLVVTDLKISDKEEYCFVKTFVVDDDELFRGLHNANIYDVDPEYVSENYSYKFVNLTTNQTKLAVVVNGFISVVGKETEKQLRQQMVAPMNGEQMLVSKAIQDPNVDLVVIEGKAGSGKAQPLSEPVLTPSGWSTMGDITEGSEVIGSDGRAKKVLKIHPQGIRDVYEVSFIDGTKVRCDKDHLWSVRCRSEQNYTKFKPTTVEDMLSTWISKERYDKRYDTYQNVYNYSIQPSAPCEYGVDTEEQIVHPYALGLLLGDGCFRNNNVGFTNSSKKLVLKLKQLLEPLYTMSELKYSQGAYNTYVIKGTAAVPFIQVIDKLGLKDYKSSGKFVPKVYLEGTLATREAVFQGLTDTDGYVKNGQILEYSTSSSQLANDYLELGRSIGKVLTINSRIPKYTYNGELLEGLRNYRIREMKSKPKSITNISKVGTEEAQCISIDGEDHLYVTTGYNLTHNTISAFSNAIKLMKLNKDKYDNILYVRAPQNDESPGEDIGYLATNDAKLDMYLGPLDGTLDFLIRSNTNVKGKKKTEIESKIAEGIVKLKDNYGITGTITTGQRGGTHHKTILILDEASSMAPATMQKMLSRVGKDCKVIVTGSQNQIDSKFLTRYNNGLAVLMQEASARKIDTNVNMFAITLEKVVRSDMAGFAEDLFAKGGDNG